MLLKSDLFLSNCFTRLFFARFLFLQLFSWFFKLDYDALFPGRTAFVDLWIDSCFSLLFGKAIPILNFASLLCARVYAEYLTYLLSVSSRLAFSCSFGSSFFLVVLRSDIIFFSVSQPHFYGCQITNRLHFFYKIIDALHRHVYVHVLWSRLSISFLTSLAHYHNFLFCRLDRDSCPATR